MPQSRSVAFSGKKKKEQLRQKRQQKGAKSSTASRNDERTESVNGKGDNSGKSGIGKNPGNGMGDNLGSKSEKYKLLFQTETREMVEKGKRKAQEDLVIPDSRALSISSEEIYDDVIDFPTRPDWRGERSASAIDAIERASFDQYLDRIHSAYDISRLSYFEHNLETWRQLWRVLELSDVVCIVADVRHPVLHFPPALYRHICAEKSKKCILILSKIDLVSPELYFAWKTYFLERFPELVCVGFTCFDRFTFRENKNIQKKRSRTVKFGNQFASQFGPVELGQALQKMRPEIDLSDWIEQLRNLNKTETGKAEPETCELADSVVRVGFVGHTNVGKSSIMNTLVGEKHFSMSIRPGHTKELQQWNVFPAVQLIDSPGIIFPSTVPRQLQVLSGMFPIDQVREPYSVIGYLAERVNLVDKFQLRHVSGDRHFTAWDICEAFAQKKNFMVARKRYADAYRGANFMLRMAVSGQICLAFQPHGFRRDAFENEDEVVAMKKVSNSDSLSRREHNYEQNHAKPSTLSKEPIRESSSDESSAPETDSEPEQSQTNRFALLDDED